MQDIFEISKNLINYYNSVINSITDSLHYIFLSNLVYLIQGNIYKITVYVIYTLLGEVFAKMSI